MSGEVELKIHYENDIDWHWNSYGTEHARSAGREPNAPIGLSDRNGGMSKYSPRPIKPVATVKTDALLRAERLSSGTWS